MGWGFDPHARYKKDVVVLLVTVLCLSMLEIEVCSGRDDSRQESQQSLEDNEAIKRFQEYLRIPTVHPDPNYGLAVNFLRRQADEIGLDVYTVELVEKKPVLIMTWPGSNSALSSILLSSHMDVVPVEEEKWIYDPFAAVIDEKGNIYGRGTQDMKGMGMHYLEAIRNLKSNGFKPLRTIHVVFVPDEEIGGRDGWEKFSESPEFASLNVGIAIDEGPISPDNSSYPCIWGEKMTWWLVIKAIGAAGHGSYMYDGSALQNLFQSIETITRFRDSQFNLVKAGTDLGEVVSVNAVFLKAGSISDNGYTMNVQPAEAEAGFDIRVPPYAVVASALDRRIADEWAPASRNLTYWYNQRASTMDGESVATAIDESNTWWVLLDKSIRTTGRNLRPQICYASTDMRFLRKLGIPAFGFTTIQEAPMLVHDHNEYVNGWAWLRGIPVWEGILTEYAQSPHTEESSRSDQNLEPGALTRRGHTGRRMGYF